MVLADDYRYMGYSVGPDILQIAYNFNANIGIAGYIGHIDYFPGYDSFLSYASFRKMRVRLNKFTSILHNIKVIGFFRRAGLSVTSFIGMPFREKYFLDNLKLSDHGFLGKNPQGRPHFVSAPYMPNILGKVLFFFLPTTLIGDT